MKFIADAMLGRLARWLRLFGFDTTYIPDIPDDMLLRTARQEGRTILTRDTHFKKRDIGGCLLIGSGDVFEQLSEVIKAFGLNEPGQPRCANCNGPLERVTGREEVRDSVPEFVYLNTERFMRCPGCGRVYWEGTQFRRFSERLKELKGDA